MLTNAAVYAAHVAEIMPKREPRKRSAPLGLVRWRGIDGSASLAREDLPSSKRKLEETIIRKFVESVESQQSHARFEQRERPSETEWPDAEYIAGGRTIGIELVEAILPDHARKRSRQDEYLANLLPRVADLEEALHGLGLIVMDGYQEPEWPPVRSTAGQRLLEEFETSLRAAVQDLQRIESFGSWVWHNTMGVRTGIAVTRGQPLPGALASSVNLRFSGTFPIDGATNAMLLARTIAGRIEQNYVPYDHGDLWLLVYSEMGFSSHAVDLARQLLAEAHEPFAAVWAFRPLPNGYPGIIDALFPY